MTSLTGLENINAGSIADLYISFNNSLSTCEVQSICNYLASPNGIVIINNNATGCNNPPEVANACGISLPCLPYGNYYFYTQSEIDNFQTNYPGCTEIEGDVTISGGDITNLNGLSVVTSIGGYLGIYFNSTLTSLAGLEGLTSIGENLEIGMADYGGNPSLTSSTGLINLTSIGGSLKIASNNSLTSMTGLESLTSIGGDLWIYQNYALTCLTGLEGLASIGGGLYIGGNWLGNPSLISLAGLINLTSIGGDLVIAENTALTSLTGLEGLTSIGGNLIIGGSDSYWGAMPS